MPELIDWPENMGAVSLEPINAPAARLGGSTETLGGFAQTTEGIGFLWQFAISIQPMHGTKARNHRGWVNAQIGGANPVRFSLSDGDIQTLAELGLEAFSGQDDQGFQYAYPDLEMTHSFDRGAIRVRLPDFLWGRKLTRGSWLGFGPLHLAAYMVTAVELDGWYRIYPPLRKDVASGDIATMKPNIALRLVKPDAANAPRNAALVEGASFVGIEVLEEHVRTYFDIQS